MSHPLSLCTFNPLPGSPVACRKSTFPFLFSAGCSDIVQWSFLPGIHCITSSSIDGMLKQAHYLSSNFNSLPYFLNPNFLNIKSAIIARMPLDFFGMFPGLAPDPATVFAGIANYLGLTDPFVQGYICAAPERYLSGLRSLLLTLPKDRIFTLEEPVARSMRENNYSDREIIRHLNIPSSLLVSGDVGMKARNFKHLDDHERGKIAAFHDMGKGVREIARLMHRDKGTISRELRRLEPGKPSATARYESREAAKDYHTKRLKSVYKGKLCEGTRAYYLYSRRIAKYILKKKYSPCTIANFFIHKVIRKDKIYKMVKEGLIPNVTPKDLIRGGKKRRSGDYPAKRYRAGRSIDQRPEEINKRLRFGDCEADSIVSPRNSKYRVFTLVERKTRFVIAKITKEGTSLEFYKFLKYIIKRYGNFIKSITVDNGSEFASWNLIEKEFNIDIYFAHPYKSNDKPQIEHMNGEIRKYYDKKTDFSKITQREFYFTAIYNINNCPRVVLDGISASEAFQKELRLKQASF